VVGFPETVFHCTGGDFDTTDPGNPYCPELRNTSLAVDDEGNYLFVLELTEFRGTDGVLRGPGVIYRYFDSVSGDYPVDGPRWLITGALSRPDTPPEGHSPSVTFVPTSDGGYFAVSTRIVSGSGGFVHRESVLVDPGGPTPPAVTFRPLDPDEALCPACDHGTSHLFFDPVSGRLRWAFTWQHPLGGTYESFDDALGTWKGADDVAWDSDNFLLLAGDLFATDNTCLDLEALDGPGVSVDTCFDPAALASYDAEHHPTLARRPGPSGVVTAYQDWGMGDHFGRLVTFLHR
jgi:hypothetical protein